MKSRTFKMFVRYGKTVDIIYLRYFWIRKKDKELIIKAKLGRLRTPLLLKLENKGFTSFSSGIKK